MRLLLVEDDISFSESLSHLLKLEGYSIDTAPTGETGLNMAMTNMYDIIILDRILPDMDGVALLKKIRKSGLTTTALISTAKDTLSDRIDGLDAGADDYLIKPFSTDELLARLRALGRRSNAYKNDHHINFGSLILDPLNYEVIKNGQTIPLTIKETLVLELLMNNCGQTLTKEYIFKKVWGYNSETEIATVALYIHFLRKKLGPTYIKTVHGVGFKIEKN